MKRIFISILLLCFSTFVFAAILDPGPSPGGCQYDTVDKSVDKQVDTPSVTRSTPAIRSTETGETTRAEQDYITRSAQYRSVPAIVRVDGPHEVGWRGTC